MKITEKLKHTPSNFVDDLFNAYESSSKLILFKMITDLDNPAVHYCIIAKNGDNNLNPTYLNKKTVKSVRVDKTELIVEIYLSLEPSDKIETVSIVIANIAEILKFKISPLNEAAVVFENPALHIAEVKNGVIQKAVVVKRNGKYTIRLKINFISFTDIYGSPNYSTIEFAVRDLDLHQLNKIEEQTLSVFDLDNWNELTGLNIRLKGKVYYPVVTKQKAFMPDFILGNLHENNWLTQQLDKICA